MGLKSGLGHGFGNRSRGPLGPTYDADAQAYFTAVSLTDTAYTVPINAFIVAGKANGWWTALDRIWVLANKTSTAALKDMKGLVSCTAANAPTFTAGQGYTFNGSTQYLDTVTALNALTNYTLNSNSFGVYVRSRTSAAAGRAPIGCDQGSGNRCTYIYFFTGNTNMVINNNNTDGETFTGANTSSDLGFWHANRSGQLAKQLYLNGSADGTGTMTTAVISTYSPYIGGVNDAGSLFIPYPGQLSLAFFGGSMNGTVAAAFAADVATLKTAIGW